MRKNVFNLLGKAAKNQTNMTLNLDISFSCVFQGKVDDIKQYFELK